MKLSLVKKNVNIESLLSETGKNVPPSGIREFFDLVYSTPDCISLGIGEPDFITPWRISEAGIHAIKEGYTHYTPNRGLPELLKLINGEIKKITGIDYNPSSEILITKGVSQGLDLALRSVINPGDEIIIFEPCYVSYAANISLLYGKPVAVSTYIEDKFRVKIDSLINAITPKTKAILLNYPANPTGGTLDKATLEKISKIAIDKNLLIIADELYSSLSYDNEHFSITSLPEMKDRTIYLNGFSKSHAMTGWRLGYAAGPEEIISIMLKIHQHTALCASSMSQFAAIEAISNAKKDTNKMKSEYFRRRNYITSKFNDIGLPCLYPEGAFYVFPDVSPSGMDGRKFALELLKSEKVAVVPGEVFGDCAKKHIRCSYATSMEDIKEAMKRIERFAGTMHK